MKVGLEIKWILLLQIWQDLYAAVRSNSWDNESDRLVHQSAYRLPDWYLEVLSIGLVAVVIEPLMKPTLYCRAVRHKFVVNNNKIIWNARSSQFLRPRF